MIYCFKKLREYKLTHIFFLHYAIALIAGSAVIAVLFLLGNGLQFHSFVVLYIMYSQPAIFMLRRMDYYEVKSDIKYGDYDIQEKIEFALDSAEDMFFTADKDFVLNGLSLACALALMLISYELTTYFHNPYLGCLITMFNIPSIDSWQTDIRQLKKKV